MIFDLHVHTKYSGDSSNEPSELIKIAKARGLDGIAVTDHDTTRGWAHFPKVEGFTVIQGIEMTTDHGSVIGLFLNEGIDAYGFWEVIDQIRGQDGTVVLPHPGDTFRRDTPKIKALDKSLLKGRIDAIEVFNSRCIFGRSNERAERLAEELGKHRVGGSDAHNIGEVGRARTLFDCGSPEEIHSKLKKTIPINTVVQGKLSSRLVHIFSFLNNLQNKNRF
jgi:predicted metal-dependent phosphoesterase TrpH